MAYTKTTWATSDVITATKLNNAENGIEDAHDGTLGMVLISDTEVTGSPVSAITVSSLSSYRKIKISLSAQVETAGSYVDITFNSDTGSNYSHIGYKFYTSSTNSGSSSSHTSIKIGNGGGGVEPFITSNFTLFEASIDNYDGEHKNLIAHSRTEGTEIRIYGGTYEITTVISSMTLTPSNDFSVGTRLLIWGCK